MGTIIAHFYLLWFYCVYIYSILFYLFAIYFVHIYIVCANPFSVFLCAVTFFFELGEKKFP